MGRGVAPRLFYVLLSCTTKNKNYSNLVDSQIVNFNFDRMGFSRKKINGRLRKKNNKTDGNKDKERKGSLTKILKISWR